MNAFLILLLCSVACCFASPTCSEREMEKCNRDYPVNVETEEDLVKLCDKMQCWIGVYERCGLNKDEAGRIGYLGYKRAYGVACDKSNPLREKMVHNLKCLNDVTKGDEMRQCRIGQESKDHREYCRQIRSSLDCLYDLVYQRCGQDAREVFVAAYPDAQIMGC